MDKTVSVLQAMIHKEDSNYQTQNIIYLFSQIEIVKYIAKCIAKRLLSINNFYWKCEYSNDAENPNLFTVKNRLLFRLLDFLEI